MFDEVLTGKTIIIDRISDEARKLGVKCVPKGDPLYALEIIQPPHWQHLYYHAQLYYVPLPRITYRYDFYRSDILYLQTVFFTDFERFICPSPLPNDECYGVLSPPHIQAATPLASAIQAFWESSFNDDGAVWDTHPFWAEIRKRSPVRYPLDGAECLSGWEKLSLREVEEITLYLKEVGDVNYNGDCQLLTARGREFAS